MRRLDNDELQRVLGSHFETDVPIGFSIKMATEILEIRAQVAEAELKRRDALAGEPVGFIFLQPDDGNYIFSKSMLPIAGCESAMPVYAAPPAVSDEYHLGYAAAMSNAQSGVRQLYIQHCHRDGVDGLLNRCKELEQSFIASEENSRAAMLANKPVIRCKGENCTSDGVSPHSLKCELEHDKQYWPQGEGRCDDCKSNGFTRCPHKRANKEQK